MYLNSCTIIGILYNIFYIDGSSASSTIGLKNSTTTSIPTTTENTPNESTSDTGYTYMGYNVLLKYTIDNNCLYICLLDNKVAMGMTNFNISSV